MTAELMDCFQCFIDNLPDFELAVANFDGEVSIEGEVLVFSLRGLQQFLADSVAVSYAEFRQQIYASTINQQLERLGWVIEVHNNRGKVDRNLYRLLRKSQVA